MKQGSVLSPHSNSIRVAFATWWIYITIVTSFYTANLTAFLTLAKFSLPINEPQDLLRLRHHFICQKGFGFDYAITNVSELERRFCCLNILETDIFVGMDIFLCELLLCRI